MKIVKKNYKNAPHTARKERTAAVSTHRKVAIALHGREVWRAVDLELLQRPLEENQPHVRYNQQIEPPGEPQHQHCTASYVSPSPDWQYIGRWACVFALRVFLFCFSFFTLGTGVSRSQSSSLNGLIIFIDQFFCYNFMRHCSGWVLGFNILRWESFTCIYK